MRDFVRLAALAKAEAQAARIKLDAEVKASLKRMRGLNAAEGQVEQAEWPKYFIRNNANPALIRLDSTESGEYVDSKGVQLSCTKAWAGTDWEFLCPESKSRHNWCNASKDDAQNFLTKYGVSLQEMKNAKS